MANRAWIPLYVPVPVGRIHLVDEPLLPVTEGQQRLLDRYVLGEPVGHGGMATVYEARDEQLERRVAVKVLDVPAHLPPGDLEDLIGRMRREARAIAGLSHPNIVAMLDMGERSGVPFLVMEYLDGVTLRQRLDRGGPLSPAQAAAILSQLAGALDAAHQQGLLHRDIKPSNIMLLPGSRDTPDVPQVKLLDFGVARQLGDTIRTRTGMMVGSPAYMAPESIRGERATRAVDIWALGALLYEMLAGKPPFDAQAIAPVFYQILNQSPPPLPNADPAVRRVLHRALEKNPSRRFASAGELARAFQAAIAPRVAAPAPRDDAAASRRPAVLAWGAVAGALSLLALVLLGQRQPSPTPGATANRPQAVLTPPAPTPVPPSKRATTAAPTPPPKRAPQTGGNAQRKPAPPSRKISAERKPRPPQPHKPAKPVRAAAAHGKAARAPAKKTAKTPPARRTPPRAQRPRRAAVTKAPARTPRRRQPRQQGASLLVRKVQLARAWIRLEKERRKLESAPYNSATRFAYNRKVAAFNRQKQRFNADLQRDRARGAR